MWLRYFGYDPSATEAGGGMAANEAFSRILIDAQLADAGWKIGDGTSVRFEYPLNDGTRAD